MKKVMYVEAVRDEVIREVCQGTKYGIIQLTDFESSRELTEKWINTYDPDEEEMKADFRKYYTELIEELESESESEEDE